jgi:hypothetical protein
LRNYLPWIHAFELNGTRTRSENAAVVNLAREHGRSLVSGGDRHACEPSACINLTNAASFSEFAAEVREGLSEVLFMPQYREPLPLRLMEMCWDVLRPYPGSAGRERWIDRVFYRGDDGLARSLAEIWQGETPWPLRIVTGALQALTAAKPQLAALLQEREEARRFLPFACPPNSGRCVWPWALCWASFLRPRAPPCSAPRPLSL